MSEASKGIKKQTKEQSKYQTEVRDGEEVVVMPMEEFKSQYKQKRVSKKQRVLQEADIDLKYLKNIQYIKKTESWRFKIVDIPSIEELKRLITIQEEYTTIHDNTSE